MSFSQRLDLRQSQQLVMTPQLQQAIKMLQMSNLELLDFVTSELERNPLLERGQEQVEELRGDDRADASFERGDVEAPLEKTLSDDSLGRAEETFDTGAENLFDQARADLSSTSPEPAQTDGPGAACGGGGEAAFEASAWATVGKGGSLRFDDGDGGLEGRVCEEVTLRAHLIKQLGLCKLSPAARVIAADLIEQIDEAGYLRTDIAETGRRLGASQDDVEAALAALHSFDPTGIGARSLKECMALQLREKDRLDPAMRCMLDNLELLAKREFAKLQKLCRVDAEDLRQMVGEIRALDPKPGAKFDRVEAQPVIPDVFVYENRSHGWTIELNAETLPRLLINNSYSAEVMRLTTETGAPEDRSKAVKEYLAECQQSANWLLKSIDQRARTILRVASEIVRQQDGFLAFGVSALKPLNLKRVADAIEMHESTVSRVTSNKFIATPRGVLELKYFFTPAIAATDGGESYSAEAIRHRIKSLIDKEPPDAVLSDDRIVAILRDSGVDIARRTVAKYREAMSIPSSLQRRKVKATAAVL